MRYARKLLCAARPQESCKRIRGKTPTKTTTLKGYDGGRMCALEVGGLEVGGLEVAHTLALPACT